MNKLIKFLFGFAEETLVLHIDDEDYPSRAMLTIINRCFTDDIEVVNIKHMYRYESMKEELVSVNITLRTTRKNKDKLEFLNRLLLSKNVHMDIKENW